MVHEPVVLPIQDTLDLHTFHPKEVPDLLYDYLDACREKGILRVRIIHGKGKGILRERVHATLRRLEAMVETFHLADVEGGDWGSTMVILRPISTHETSDFPSRGDGDG